MTQAKTYLGSIQSKKYLLRRTLRCYVHCKIIRIWKKRTILVNSRIRTNVYFLMSLGATSKTERGVPYYKTDSELRDLLLM